MQKLIFHNFDFLYFDLLIIIALKQKTTTIYQHKSYLKIFFVAIGLLVLLDLYSCKKAVPRDIANYIHVAHTRIFDTINQVVDPRFEKINYDKFDMTLIGGDLCEETSKRYDILEYIDGVFDIDNPNTLWALGNHDNARLDFVKKATKRDHFYSYHQNGITFIVLYTQEEVDWMCTISGKQLELIKNVTDTISKSSHLVLMTHKLIWLKDIPQFKPHRGKTAYDWSCNYKIHRNGWVKEIVPMLRSVKAKGIEVIALAGDIGNNVEQFDEQTPDGIHYLASGSNPKNKNAKFLQFRHNKKTKELKWKFVHLEDFLANGQKLYSGWEK